MRTLILLSVPALAIGIGSALVLWALEWVSEYVKDAVWETLPGVFGADASTPWWIFVVLTLTGFFVGLIVWLVPGHGGPDSATTELAADPPKPGELPTLAAVTVLGLAGGVSLGPENPIMAMNASLAVLLVGRVVTRMPKQLLVLLAASGTLGALFGTPVAAALMFTGVVAAVRSGGSLWDKLFLPLVAAGAGSVTMLLLGGQTIAFTLAPMGPVEPLYLAQGVIVAAASALLCILAAFVFPYIHRAFHALRNPLVFTTLGGAILGILGILGGPMTLFKGLDQTAELLTHPDDYSPGQFALFAGIKVVALLVAASAGFRGGRIFPSVFIGVSLGLLGYALLPGIPISLAVACGAMGITLAAVRDGWIAIFIGVALCGDLAVLPLLCIIILPVWLIVSKAPELVVHPRPAKDAHATT